MRATKANSSPIVAPAFKAVRRSHQEGQVVSKALNGQSKAAETNACFTHNFTNIPVFSPAAAYTQPKLTVNEPGDAYEQEADQMADMVMRIHDNSSPANPVLNHPLATIQRKCSACEAEKKEYDGEHNLMRKSVNGGGYQASPSLNSQLSRTKGGGAPLPESARSVMENAFQTDFSCVRIHTDGQAGDMSQGIQARAFTHGRDIYFNRGQFAPESVEGKRLLAHELVHVVQQGTRNPHPNVIQRTSDSPSGSDSSGSGARRSVWDKIREAASGVWEAGPIDAWDAGVGEDAEAAETFSDQFEDYWVRNAARHGVWQARLSFKHGIATAQSIGDAHESGATDVLDSWIDQYNNRVARRIGQDVASLDEIPAAVQTALDDGRLITSPDDERIPEAIRNTHSEDSSSRAYRPSL